MAAIQPFPEADQLPVREVAAFWLANASARSVLNPDLATALRVFLDGPTTYVLPFLYCPTCGRPLQPSDDDDPYFRSFKCPEHHQTAVRGLRVLVEGEQSPPTFDYEPNTELLTEKAHRWLESEVDVPAGNIHPTLRAVLDFIVTGR